MMGTNDNPGDYRSSGCSGCHVVYANDRDPFHSAQYAKFGNLGMSQQVDPTIPHNESGHPLKHEFTREIPTSQCMICHMHQPNMFINTMVGYTMWDYESDAPFMWPEKQKYPTDAEQRKILDRNPEEAAIRGKWGDFDFMKDVSLLNPQLKDTQFADYHGHGWNFRGVYSRDRKGDLLDKNKQIVDDNDPDKWKKAVHLQSIHVDVGMQCVDCHYAQDNHGDGYIKAEVMGAVEIQCQDCHGTVDKYPTLKTSGPAASQYGRDLLLIRNPDGKKRFEWIGGKLIQRSAVTPGLEWTMSLLKDDSLPGSPGYDAKAVRAHTIVDESRHAGLGRQRAEGTARAQRRQDALLHLPHLVDHELRRLPSADPGQLENRTPQIRRRRDAQLRDVQPAGRARRHVLPRRARRDQGSQDRAGAFVLGADPVVDQHQPRTHLHAAAADLVGRLLVAGVRAALPAHRTQAPKPRIATTATSPRTTTTTPSWRRRCCSARSSSTSSATTPGSAKTAASARCRSPSGTNRRP